MSWTDESLWHERIGPLCEILEHDFQFCQILRRQPEHLYLLGRTEFLDEGYVCNETDFSLVDENAGKVAISAAVNKIVPL